MKILLVGPANSIHMQRWFSALCARGHEVTLATQHPSNAYPLPQGGKVVLLKYRGLKGYALNRAAVVELARRTAPDIVNAHYASGYGLIASAIRSVPTLLSVWGSDVFDFPYESWWKGWLIRWNLKRASRIASTSEVMASQVVKLIPTISPIFVTPFGVDCSCFQPHGAPDSNLLTIGTVKTLAPKYGIDLLIRAFASLLAEPDIKATSIAGRLRLILVGGGEQRAALEGLTTQLGISEKVEFVGQVDHDDVPKWLGRLNVYVAPSRLDSESFGVAAIEASACGVPVVVSNAGGLPEVVVHGVTGLVFPREDVSALTQALKQLVLNDAMRRSMGEAGRERVIKHYEWNRCVDVMLECYRAVIEGGAPVRS